MLLEQFFFLYVYDGGDLYMSHGTIILFNLSFLKLSELSPSWALNVTEILESLLSLNPVKLPYDQKDRSCLIF